MSADIDFTQMHCGRDKRDLNESQVRFSCRSAWRDEGIIDAPKWLNAVELEIWRDEVSQILNEQQRSGSYS